MEEIVAMHMFHRQRAIDGVVPLFSSEKFDMDKLQKKLRSLLYPDEAFSDLRALKKSIEFFKKVRGMDFKVKPV